MKPHKKTTPIRGHRPFTLFVSGNDTGVGKTYVLGRIARALARCGHKIELVKVVETGVRTREMGDARRANILADHANVSHSTLLRFRQPLAPLAAAKAEGRRLTLALLLRAIQNLPATDCRLIEGAGGLAVPLDNNGSDWADLAQAIRADLTLLVVEDRLGAINQARLLAKYASVKRVPNYFFILNRIHSSSPSVHASNREGLRASGLRLFPSPGAVALFVARSIARPDTAIHSKDVVSQ